MLPVARLVMPEPPPRHLRDARVAPDANSATPISAGVNKQHRLKKVPCLLSAVVSTDANPRRAPLDVLGWESEERGVVSPSRLALAFVDWLRSETRWRCEGPRGT